MHWGWLWFAILVAWCSVVATAAQGQTPPPIRHVEVMPQAKHVLDSLAHQARTQRVENGACVVAYVVRDSVLTLEHLERAVYDSADSISIRARGAICPEGVPVIHSHVAFDGMPYPSDIDKATAARRGTWNMLLSVHDSSYFLVVY